jgi:hypothetical protein
MEGFVTFDVPKVAMSVVEFGTLCGAQFAAVFQSPLVGFFAQVALPARLVMGIRKARKQEKRQRRTRAFITRVVARPVTTSKA